MPGLPAWDLDGERVSDVGEDGLLDLIFQELSPPHSGVRIAAGDDAASIRVPRGNDLLATCDSQIEGVHFRKQWLTPRELGSRASNVNLSDLAAMGASPYCALLNLALESHTPVGVVLELFRGALSQLRPAGASIIGGNLSRSECGLSVDMTLMGICRSGMAVKRSGAAEGDAVYVSGYPGMAGACVGLLERGLAVPSPQLLGAFKAPEPRISLGRKLARKMLATAMIDISDGLACDLNRLALASAVRIRLEEELVPLGQGLESAALSLGLDPMRCILGPSEDYELIFTIRPEHEARLLRMAEQGEFGVHLTRIGYCATGEPGLERSACFGDPVGWDHYRGDPRGISVSTME